MEVKFRQKFKTRQEISDLLGGDTQKGIAKSIKTNTILLFMNEDGLYSDYFYPKGKYDYCMYTGIGRKGHQDNVSNVMYDLNMEIMTHKRNNKNLIVFEHKSNEWIFIGQYELLETHQNVQPDDNNELRRVFVFHLHKISDFYSF